MKNKYVYLNILYNINNKYIYVGYFKLFCNFNYILILNIIDRRN